MYILNTVGTRGEKALYVFNASVIDAASDGSRLSPSKKNPLPSDVGGGAQGRGLSIYNDELYMLLSASGTGTDVFDSGMTVASTSVADGQTLTGSRHTVFNLGGTSQRNEYGRGFSVIANLMFVFGIKSSKAFIDAYARDSGLATTQRFTSFQLADEDNDLIDKGNVTGLKVIDDVFYVIKNRELVRNKFNTSINRYQQQSFMNLPAGLTNPHWLDMLT